MITPIDATSVRIENAQDLATIATVNSAITHVYFEQDIIMTTGITINPDRATLVLDGEYPIGSGIVHSFTDHGTTSTADTLGIHAGSSIAITLRNMTIHGNNYYGVPCIEGNSDFYNTRNVVVRYENVTYSGPQMGYCPDGSLVFTDCNIHIYQSGATEAQEVAEASNVTLGGQTTIQHDSTVATRAVFWFRDETTTSQFTVLSGASVRIVSANNYFMYNYDGWLTPTTLVPTNYTIQSGASLQMTINKGISYTDAHILQSFTIGDGAAFDYAQTSSNDGYATLYVSGAVTVGQNAVFHMRCEQGTQPIIRYTNGAGRSLTAQSPKSLVLYSPNAPALYSAGTTQFTINAGQLNLWTTARTPYSAAGGFDDTPQQKWHKLRYASILQMQGSFTQTSTSATSNLIGDDEPYPALNNLTLHNARVLSAGDWPVQLDPVVDNGSPITGTTEPYGNVRIEYETDGGVAHVLTATADANGNFTIATTGETPPSIPAGTQLNVFWNIPFLIKETEATATGTLSIVSAPEHIIYEIRAISSSPVLLPRTNPLVPVVISDTRDEESEWILYAAISGPLTAGDTHVLPDALVYCYYDASSQRVLETLSETTPLPVHTGGPGRGTYSIAWPVGEGILARITEPLHIGQVYSSYIIWTVEPVSP